MKRLLTLISLISLVALLLSACGNTGDECTHVDKNDDKKCDECSAAFEDGCDAEHKDANDDGKCDVGGEDFDDGKEIAPGTIYANNSFLALVYSKGDPTFVEDAAFSVRDHMLSKINFSPTVFLDTGIAFPHELVIGDTARDITATAKDILEEKLARKAAELEAEGEDIDDLAGYMIYSDGSSVAVVWSDFQLAELATNYFCENYLTESELILEAGYEKSEFLPLLDFLKEREEKILAERWAALEAQIPEEYRESVMTEMKRIYELYDDKAVPWIASLYEPETGGFYAANSAKNIGLPSYGPDIEHTLYGFTALAHTGMAEMFNNSWEKAAPQELLTKAAEWMISLQREDGFFHHPQWTNPSDLRLNRDVGSAKRIIAAAGLKPKYSGATPSGNNLLGNLGGSSAVAASKVVSVSEVLSHFESVEAFRAHLAAWDAELVGASDADRAWKFYFWGSTCQSTAGYFTGEYRTLIIEFFDKHQNPENGVWSNGIYLNSTNAIHKIGSVYNSLHAELKYTDKMIETTLTLLKNMQTNTTCEIYNVWSCFQYIYRNVRNYSTGTPDERAARCDAMKERAYPELVAAIRSTYDHLIHYRYEDGSFSYYRGYSLYAAQGCPTAVRGTAEGDIAGYILAVYDMPYFILAALELENYHVYPFTEEDRVRYVNALYDVINPPKLEIKVTDPVTYDFEKDTVDEVPEGVKISGNAANGAYVKVASDGNGNKVLEYNAVNTGTVTKGNYTVTVKANHTSTEPTAASLELKINVDKTSAQVRNLITISINDANSGAPVIKLSVGRTLSILNLYDASGNKIAKIGNAGKVISLSLDYDFTSGTCSIKADGTTVATVTLSKMSTPGSFSISTPYDVKAKYQLDDIVFKTYKAE